MMEKLEMEQGELKHEPITFSFYYILYSGLFMERNLLLKQSFYGIDQAGFVSFGAIIEVMTTYQISISQPAVWCCRLGQ